MSVLRGHHNKCHIEGSLIDMPRGSKSGFTTSKKSPEPVFQLNYKAENLHQNLDTCCHTKLQNSIGHFQTD